MLKPDFDIQTNHAGPDDYAQCRLLMEVNPQAFSYVLLSVRGMRPLAIRYFQWNTLKAGPTEEILQEIIQEDELLSTVVNETFLVYNFPESNLVPERFFSFDINRAITDLVYGNLGKGLILNEKIPWWELHNVYRIPASIHRLMEQKFHTGRYWHLYSLQLKCHKMFTAKEEPQFLKTLFYADKMILLAFRNGQLLLSQTFSYQDAKDVAYHLLNCCAQLGMSQEELLLEVSGLIERQSVLHNELLKYFVHVQFEQMEDSIKVTDEMKEFPLHYFSSLLKMAVCV